MDNTAPPHPAGQAGNDAMAERLVARLRAAGCVFAEDEAALLLAAAAEQAGRGGGLDRDLASLADRRVAGMPLEHVIGWAEFCGQRVAVGPGVFIPRRRTEFLVGQAVAAAGPGSRSPADGPATLTVVDLCCGSGALGVALAAALSQPGTGFRVSLHAADADPAAVACARRNVIPAGGRVYTGDLFAALPAALRGRIDVLLANVPYVPSREIALLPAEAREYEPRLALDGGPDGLAVLRRVTAAAPGWLAPGGVLLSEVSDRQSAAASAAASEAGLAARLAADPDLGATVLIAIAPGRSAVLRPG
jgi:release factor glutamine methyltransferase